MSAEPLTQAREGDAEAFRALTEPHRRELQAHCYRFVGSTQDAEDLVQETLLAAWRALDRFEERASVRSWLYRIATNRCLNALRDRRRRPRETVTEMPPGFPEPTRRDDPVSLQPYPDVLLDGIPDEAPGPEARYEAKEAISLAFVEAVQHLPPRQRAVLLMRDVLGFRAAEVAEALETTTASVNSALQRARGTVDERSRGDAAPSPEAGSMREQALVGRFADAFEGGDVPTLVALLAEDAQVTMPPAPGVYDGRTLVAGLPRDRLGPGRCRLLPIRANGQPGFAYYLRDDHAPLFRNAGFFVLTLAGDEISGLTRFADTALLTTFGLPRTLPALMSPSAHDRP
jgi:RNA polymerase sigma-70 factor (TIGR02960 family)